MALPLPAQDGQPARMRLVDLLVAAVLAGCGPIARVVYRLRPRQRSAYSPGIVVVSVDRGVGDDDSDATRLLESMVSPGRHQPRWVDGVVDPGEGWQVIRSGGEPQMMGRGPIDERGHWTFHLRAIVVEPGTEWLAISLVRLAAWRSVRGLVTATRWPRFRLASGLAGNLTPHASAMLATRAGRAGTTPHRVAVIDTPFSGPPDVNVVSSNSPRATPLTGSYPHGAAVCSLVRGASPHATIDLYPVLRADGDEGVDGLSVFAALSLVRERAVDGHFVDVVNLSLTTPSTPYPEQVEQQLDRLLFEISEASQARTAFVAATGNDGGEMGMPARLGRVLGVGCADADGLLWARSSGGSKPATGIGPHGWLVAQGVGLVDREDGTSYAAASVAGLIALDISNGIHSWQATSDLLQYADRSFAEYSPERYGAGRATDTALA